MKIRELKKENIKKVVPIFQEIHHLHAMNRKDIFKDEKLAEELIQSFLSDINLVAEANDKIVAFLFASVIEVQETKMTNFNKVIKIAELGVAKSY